MKIQIGEVEMSKVREQQIPLQNRTKKYLLPCLKEYGEEFISKINNVFKVAVGIGDIISIQHHIDLTPGKEVPKPKFERHLFILIDTGIASDHFIHFLDWVKEQSMYVDDYVFDNIQKSQYHMIVIQFPEKYYDSFDTFKKGKYSKMFNTNGYDLFTAYPEIRKILIKDHTYAIKFVKQLNKEFNTTIKPEEWAGEFDFPPNENEEVFNHHLKH